MRGIKIVYDSDNQILTCGDVWSPLKPVDDVIRLRILLDRTSIEVFGNDGRVYLPLFVIPEDDNLSLKAAADKGEVKVNYLRVHELKSIWE